MSISSTTRKAGPFAGNGVQTVFPFTFKVFATTDPVATRATAGVETVLTNGVDYSVNLNANQDSAPGGDVTLTAALAVGATLAITSDVPALQAVTVTNGGGFFPAVFNAVFDRLTILVQQLGEKLTRSMKIPVTATGVTSLDVPVLGGAVLQWSADGTHLVAQSLPDLSLSLALPDQAGHNGHFFKTNGLSSSWAAIAQSDVAGLTAALTAKADATRTLTAAGLVTGGGDLSANRTFTVTAALAADVRTGTDTTKAMTAGALMGSSARQVLTDAATIAMNCASGYNATVTPTVSGRTVGAPTNMFDGEPISLEVVNSAGGALTVAWNAIWQFGASGTPVIPTAVGSYLIVGGIYNARTSKIDVVGAFKSA